MSKPREFWIHNHDKFGLEVHEKEPQLYHYHVREVLPQSTNIIEMAERMAMDRISNDPKGHLKVNYNIRADDYVSGFKAGHISRDAEVAQWKQGHLDQATNFLETSNKQHEEITRMKAEVEHQRELHLRVRSLAEKQYEKDQLEITRLCDALGKVKIELSHAVNYLEATYVNVEDCEPEVQLCNGFKKVLTNIDKALEGK